MVLKKSLLILLIFSCLFSINGFAYVKPVFIALDGQADSHLPIHFRISNDLISNDHVNLKGLHLLHSIASGQFTVQQIKSVIKKVHHPIIVIDLRQECHGFVNGQPISWYAKHNWMNAGKTSRQIHKEEVRLLKALKLKHYITVYRILHKSSTGLIVRVKPTRLKPRIVLSERQVVKKVGLRYKRFYITDHSVPTKKQARAFIRFIHTVPKGTWLYFHCRAGKGRTTTFLVMLDIIKNSDVVSLNDILRRQYLLGGKDLRIISSDSFKHPLTEKRIDFIRWFYQREK